MATFGTLLLFWNLVQSLIPMFTGGLSDRYGYKQTIFASTVIKSLGYLVMAWFHSYWGFFAGAMLLATGTAIFKPGVQGTLIKATNRRNSSMAWGIFYQTVNIGGWIGPLDRAANAAAGLEIRLLHQRRGDLLQLPAAADLSRAGQGGAPRPPAAPPRRRKRSSAASCSKRWPNSRSPTSRSTSSSSPSGG